MSRYWLPERSTATWRAIIALRVSALDSELGLIKNQSRTFGYKKARQAIDRARAQIEQPASPWKRLLLWWSGAQIELAWAALREAGDWLVTVQQDATLTVQVPTTEQLVSEQLGSRDARRDDFDKMLKALGGKSTFDAFQREQLRGIRVAAHGVSDDRMRGIRRFRNLMLLASFALTVGLLALGIAHAIDTDLVSLCSAGTRDMTSTDVCLDGSANPSRGDLFEVEMIGAIGGLLAALLALGRVRRAPGPYSLAPVQGLLKAPAGAATALIGVLLIQSGALGLEPEQGSNLLGYAALFGFAQQLLTTLVDRRATELAQPADEEETPGS